MQGKEQKKTEDILLEAGLISPQKLKEIKDIALRTGEKIERILLSEGVINYKEILEITAKKMGVEYIDLENVIVSKDAVFMLSAKIAVKYNVFPFNIKNNLLFLAMQNPDDIFLIDEIKVFTQMEIKPFLADNRLLSRAIMYFYGDGNVESRIEDSDEGKVKTERGNEKKEEFKSNTISILSDDSTESVDELFRFIILKALKINCFDIHIDSLNKKLRIRYRVDGSLLEEDSRHNVGYEELIVKVKVMAGLFTCDRNAPQKGFINYAVNEKEKVNLEVLVLPVVGGEKILIKLQNCSCHHVLEDIGISEKEMELISGMLAKRTGMIVVSGLGGSGKTTTCYAMIKRIVAKELNIITIEKRNTIKIEGISQIQLYSKKDSAEQEFIESVLAHDPDVIVADLNIDGTSGRSLDILKQLMNTAISGKLVIVTMDFPSVFETISGLLNMGVERYLVSTSIEGIIAQHLVRKVCTSCQNSKQAIAYLDLQSEIGKNAAYVEQCSICNNVGYKGKIGIFEVFHMDSEYRRLINKGDNPEIIEHRMQKESSSFKNNCIRLIKDKITTVEEVVRLGIGKDIFSN
ncbi:MAG: ATPase, T2SS/T4P/T4SS family [Clostridia bacterium]|nr:ATPase, T2SS/T4P/T4SS family [Clostridia bacterium]